MCVGTFQTFLVLISKVIRLVVNGEGNLPCFQPQFGQFLFSASTASWQVLPVTIFSYALFFFFTFYGKPRIMKANLNTTGGNRREHKQDDQDNNEVETINESRNCSSDDDDLARTASYIRYRDEPATRHGPTPCSKCEQSGGSNCDCLASHAG